MIIVSKRNEADRFSKFFSFKIFGYIIDLKKTAVYNTIEIEVENAVKVLEKLICYFLMVLYMYQHALEFINNT